MEGGPRSFIRVSQAENQNVKFPDIDFTTQLDDDTIYRSRLCFSEAARRNRDWDSAANHLLEILRTNHGDTRRVANVQYRLARLYFTQWRDKDTSRATTSDIYNNLLNRAVRQAAEASLTFQAMRNDHGTIRARCLLTRMLVAAGSAVEADHMLEKIEAQIEQLDGSIEAATIPLRARLARARGELRLRVDPEEGKRLLHTAATLFDRSGDWANNSDTLRLIRESTA